MALDGDATLALEIHIIEHLGLHILGGHGIGALQQTVGKCRLAMVDMRYDAEISDIFHLSNLILKTDAPRKDIR